MHSALLIAQREYLENIKTRGFWLSILLMPIILALMAAVPILLNDSATNVKYTVIDNSAWVLEAVQKNILKQNVLGVLESSTVPESSHTVLQQVRQQFHTPLSHDEAGEGLEVVKGGDKEQFANDVVQLLYTLRREHASISATPTLLEQFVDWWQNNPHLVLEIIPHASFGRFTYVELANTSTAHLRQLVNTDQMLGYFIIPEDPVNSSEGAIYASKNLTNRDLQLWFSRAVSEVVQRQRIQEESIQPEIANWIQQAISFEAQVISDGGVLEPTETGDTLVQWMPVAFVYLLWVSIFAITQMLLTNTVEEKSNKLVEVLLSSVSARALMTGKILGIAATGLTVVGCWLLASVLLILALPVFLGEPLPLDLVSLVSKPLYLGSFVLYFILGYLFYAALLCGVGSLCNTLKEAQNLIMPVQLILFVPLMVMIPIGKDPNGTLAIVMSWIPPFTPFAMMNRAAFPPGPFTYLFTTLLMLVSIYAALHLAGRIFERGILMTGKAPKLRQILRFLRHGDTPHNKHRFTVSKPDK